MIGCIKRTQVDQVSRNSPSSNFITKGSGIKDLTRMTGRATLNGKELDTTVTVQLSSRH